MKRLSLQYSDDALHTKAYQSDGNPAAKCHKDWLTAGFYKFDDMSIQPNGRHCHNDKKFA